MHRCRSRDTSSGTIPLHATMFKVEALPRVRNISKVRGRAPHRPESSQGRLEEWPPPWHQQAGVNGAWRRGHRLTPHSVFGRFDAGPPSPSAIETPISGGASASAGMILSYACGPLVASWSGGLLPCRYWVVAKRTGELCAINAWHERIHTSYSHLNPLEKGSNAQRLVVLMEQDGSGRHRREAYRLDLWCGVVWCGVV